VHSKHRIASGLASVTLALGMMVLVIPLATSARASRVAASFEPLSSGFQPAPLHSLVLRATSRAKTLHLTVNLKLPDEAALEAYISDLSNRHSTLFHHFLTKGQFGRVFGPSLAEVHAVDEGLRDVGLDPGPVSSNHISIPVTATVGRLEKALSLSFSDYRLAGGQVVYDNTVAPRLPSAIVPAIAGIVGLDSLDFARPIGFVRSPAQPNSAPSAASHSATPQTAGANECAAAATGAADYDAYSPAELAAAYGMTGLYDLGDLGQGTTIALIELEPESPSEISTYEGCFRISPTIIYDSVDGGPTTTGPGGAYGSGEAALDIETIIGLAPQATVDVYQSPNGDEYDDYSAAINADAPVISTSWGTCEQLAGKSFAEQEQNLFQQAAAQGETIFAAAGDTGSAGCYNDTSGSDKTVLAVADPASQPNVVGVGGTRLEAAPYATSTSQGVWNNSLGASGGGISTLWPMPAYQSEYDVPGVINSYSSGTPCGDTSGDCREVPDVSADADPDTGYLIYYGVPDTSDPPAWAGYGGTSASTPLWAAIAALTDSSPFCADYGSGHPGDLPSSLYKLASKPTTYSEMFTDITTGNNDWAPSGTGRDLYPATAGYNLAAGLGAPIVGYSNNFTPGLAAGMCYIDGTRNTATTITSILPDSGSTTAPTDVTITGTGFLPIAGADRLLVGTTVDTTVTCSSSTTCTAVLPPQSGGSVTITSDVEGLAQSAGTAFTYGAVGAPPPGVTVTVPGAPTDPVASYSSSNRDLSFSWTAPTNTGGAPITEYSVNPILNGSAGATITVTGATSATLASPIVGDSYGFTVEAINSAGAGPASAESNIVTIPAATVPVPPKPPKLPITGGTAGYVWASPSGTVIVYGNVVNDGGVAAKGFTGLKGRHPLPAPIVGSAALSNGSGYYLVTAKGNVYNFGHARWMGSMAGRHINGRVTGMALSPSGGYYLVSSRGSVYNFDAPFLGSRNGKYVNGHIVALATTTGGYYLASSRGSVYNFHAPWYGSLNGKGLTVVGIWANSDGSYSELTANGSAVTYSLILP
jgi:hypothetical protein